MKRKSVLLTIIALTLTLVLFAACNSYDSTLQQLNRLLKVDYSEVKLTVTTTSQDITLTGIYTLTFDGDKTVIDYSYDKLNGLDINGNNADSYVSTVSGHAVVEDGMIVEGNTAEQLPQEINYNGLSFKQAFFANYTMTGAKFEADVKVPKGFTGDKDLECSNMHVSVLYNNTAISKIAITYVSEKGADVSITYLFTK